MSWSTCHVNFLTYSFFWSLLPSIPCWANPFRTLGFLNPFHSLGIIDPFHPFLPPSFPWAFAKFFGLPRPIFTSSFFYISYNSHEPTISFLGASSICLLSIKPLIILVGLLTIIPAILTQWSLFYYSFFLYFSYCWASFAIGPLCQKWASTPNKNKNHKPLSLILFC